MIPHIGSPLASGRHHPHRVDARDFPALARKATEIGAPLACRIRGGARWRTITGDGFFVPEDLRCRLRAAYRLYARWLLFVSVPRRAGGLFLPSLHDALGLVVRADHLAWWQGLLDQCAPYVYNGLRLDAAPHAATLAATEWAYTAETSLAAWCAGVGVGAWGDPDDLRVLRDGPLAAGRWRPGRWAW